MLVVLMNEARTVEELLILVIVATLSAWLLDRGDDVIWSATMKLPSSRALWPITIAAIMIVIVVVAVIIVSFFMTIIIETWWAVGASNLGDILLMPLVGFFGVCILIGRVQHLTDCPWWLPIELGA